MTTATTTSGSISIIHFSFAGPDKKAGDAVKSSESSRERHHCFFAALFLIPRIHLLIELENAA